MADSMAGRLLVAGPRLVDPNFFRTVVLVCAHDDGDGALGLVLNRPSDVPVGDHLPGWVERLTRPEVVFAGGPVQVDMAVGLGLAGPAREPPGWSAIAGRLGLVDLTLSPGEVVGDLAALRVFSGYAGWAPGQLEEEIGGGDWVIVPPADDDALGPHPGDLWREVLRRQSGPAALYAHYPLDPSTN